MRFRQMSENSAFGSRAPGRRAGGRITVAYAFAIGIATGAIAPARAATVARGQLRTVAPGHAIGGGVSVVDTDGARYVELDDRFATVAGPALRVVLYRKLPGGAADYVDLGALAEERGAQVYAVPTGVSLSDYPIVAIWCSKFDVTFGAAELTAPRP